MSLQLSNDDGTLAEVEKLLKGREDSLDELEEAGHFYDAIIDDARGRSLCGVVPRQGRRAVGAMDEILTEHSGSDEPPSRADHGPAFAASRSGVQAVWSR